MLKFSHRIKWHHKIFHLLINRTINQKLSETQSYRKEIAQKSFNKEEYIAPSERVRDEAQVEKHVNTRELNIETKGMMSLKDACHRSRCRCGQNAKDLAELVSSLSILVTLYYLF